MTTPSTWHEDQDRSGGGDSDPGYGDSTITASPPGESGRTHSGAGNLRRGGPHRVVAGVAVGLADYFDMDPTLVRMGFVVLSLLGGLAVPLYLAGWLLIPEESAGKSIAEELLARERIR